MGLFQKEAAVHYRQHVAAEVRLPTSALLPQAKLVRDMGRPCMVRSVRLMVRLLLAKTHG